MNHAVTTAFFLEGATRVAGVAEVALRNATSAISATVRALKLFI